MPWQGFGSVRALVIGVVVRCPSSPRLELPLSTPVGGAGLADAFPLALGRWRPPIAAVRVGRARPTPSWARWTWERAALPIARSRDQVASLPIFASLIWMTW